MVIVDEDDSGGADGGSSCSDRGHVLASQPSSRDRCLASPPPPPSPSPFTGGRAAFSVDACGASQAVTAVGAGIYEPDSSSSCWKRSNRNLHPAAVGSVSFARSFGQSVIGRAIGQLVRRSAFSR